MSRRIDLSVIVKAINFAAFKHRNQRRKDADASPYINHPIGTETAETAGSGLVSCRDRHQACPMARPLRIEYPGALRYLTSRGDSSLRKTFFV
ncbi:MAG: hypothetical protein ACREVT_11950 [Burkholderiales bacterium]